MKCSGRRRGISSARRRRAAAWMRSCPPGGSGDRSGRGPCPPCRRIGWLRRRAEISLSTSARFADGTEAAQLQRPQNAPCEGRGSSPTSCGNSVPWSAAARDPRAPCKLPVNAQASIRTDAPLPTSVPAAGWYDPTMTNRPDAPTRLLACGRWQTVPCRSVSPVI